MASCPDMNVTIHATEDVTQLLRDARAIRRERIATAVLAGFANRHTINESSASHWARHAIQWADTLIAALDAEGGDG